MMRAVLVSGSRDWTEIDPVLAFIQKHDVLSYPLGRLPVLIHGTARGLDTMAAGLAHARNWNVIAVPPMPARPGFDLTPEDFLRRNQFMVGVLVALQNTGAYDCHVGCFPTETARGTWDLHRRAKRAGFTPEVIRA